MAPPIKPHPTQGVSTRRRKSSGFTLVEVIFAAGISGILLAGVLTSFLFFCKSGLAMSNHYDMEQEARNLVQRLALDAREAVDATWNDAATLVLSLDGNHVTYAYDAENGTLKRTAAGENDKLIASEISQLEFKPYSVNGNLLPLTPGKFASSSQNTKMIQILISLGRANSTSPGNNTTIATSRYMLRNKAVPVP